MQLCCNACGNWFRSALAEAKHRHNFPIMCSRNKRFEKWMKEVRGAKITQADKDAAHALADDTDALHLAIARIRGEQTGKEVRGEIPTET